MISVPHMIAAVCFSTAVLLAFAVLRRIMRAEAVPKLLENSVTAYALALLSTVLFAASMMGVGFALAPKTGALNAFIITLVMHIALWVVIRLIVPLRAAQPGHGSVVNVARDDIATGGAM